MDLDGHRLFCIAVQIPAQWVCGLHGDRNRVVNHMLFLLCTMHLVCMLCIMHQFPGFMMCWLCRIARAVMPDGDAAHTDFTVVSCNPDASLIGFIPGLVATGGMYKDRLSLQNCFLAGPYYDRSATTCRLFCCLQQLCLRACPPVQMGMHLYGEELTGRASRHHVNAAPPTMHKRRDQVLMLCGCKPTTSV